MAFRPPKPHAPQRVYTSTQPARHANFAEVSSASAPGAARLEDSQEWILFSPAQPSHDSNVPDTIVSHTTSTDQTNRTAGRSRLSEYGSLGTGVRSWEAGTDDVHEDTAHESEDEELDSLDSHLLEFRSHDSAHYHDERAEETPHGLLSQHLMAREQEVASHSVFPNHDGLGSFQLGRRAASNPASPAQEHQQFSFPSQQYNQSQRKMKRRRESLDLILAREQTAREQEEEKEREKRTRIEEWRMEQSRAIMEEVQKESRRQRQRMAGKRMNTLREYHEGEMASMGGVLGDVFDDMNMSQPKLSEHAEEDKEEAGTESFWARITRRVIQDLMGIDDSLLGILFGESLPDDLETQLNNVEAGVTNSLDGHAAESGWENRLLERIARELGLLVNQISDHPGAFNTYLRVQQEPLPYAGLPIIPESTPDAISQQPILSPRETTATQRSSMFLPTIPAAKPEPIVYDPISSSRHYFDSEMDYFPPPAPAPAQQTTQNLAASHASSAYQLPSHSIYTVTSAPASQLQDSSPAPRATSTAQGFTKEEWEKQLDIGLVFKYLRSRFSSRKTMSHPPFTRTYSAPAEAAARAARVRQHHPLVAGCPVVERRASYKVVVPAPVGAALQRRRSSSCASQSTKLSASQRSRRLSGSSRCYWDIGCGGSLGSGSIIVSTRGMGGWGDV